MPVKKNKNLSLKELATKLSVSDATVRNWVKLNKIKPDYTEGKLHYFSDKNVKKIIKTVKSKTNNLLKSRRNKKYISGAEFYKDYVSKDSKNIKPIREIVALSEKTEPDINLLLGECGLQLLTQCLNIKTETKSAILLSYLDNKLNLGDYSRLIDDFIDNREYAKEYIKTHSELFNTDYVYEKNEDIIGLLYLSLRNKGERKSQGAYYTPTEIVKTMVKRLDINQNDKILDPCCGGGNFLLQLSDNVRLDNLYGNDLDCISIKITRINMALKYKPKNISTLYKHFTCENYLTSQKFQGFDYVIGNPPWGSEFSQSDYDYLKQHYLSGKTKRIESYDVFIEKSLSILNKDGILSFVLPEAILCVKTHKKIREVIINSNSINYLEYLGNIFDGVQCPSIVLEIKHNNKPSCIGTKIKLGEKIFTIKKERDLTSDGFYLSTDDKEYIIMKKLLNPENKLYLKNNAIFGLGIVTGDNKTMVKSTKTKKNEVILKGSDISKYCINECNNYIEYNPKKFQQCAPTEYYRAKEKLLYRFISPEPIFAYDNNQTLSLNSCNLLIPNIDGLGIKYILAVLNSSVSRFIFQKQYRSVKVLRSHIESVPIAVPDKKSQKEIIELVDKILSAKNDSEKSRIYEMIDKKIAKLYGLEEKDLTLLNG